jgi:hypothetical protein
MKKPLKTTILLLFSTTSIFAQTEGIIFAGQSNMVGKGTASQAPIPNAKCLQYNFNTSKTVPLIEPSGFNIGSFQMGSSISTAFATVYQSLTQDSLLIYKTAKGGTATPAWTDNGLLTESINRIKMAVSKTKVVPKKVIWFQGESDATLLSLNTNHKELYVTNTKTIINSYRNAFGNDLEFYFITIGKSRKGLFAFADTIRGLQREIAADLKRVYIGYDSCEYFPFNYTSDSIHFTQKALNIIGRGVAKNVYSLQNSESIINDDPVITSLSETGIGAKINWVNIYDINGYLLYEGLKESFLFEHNRPYFIVDGQGNYSKIIVQ